MGYPYYGSSVDFGFLPPGVNGDVQVFDSNNNAITQWQQWTKPRGVTMCWMMCIAGGGGGGGGFQASSGNARGGGAGGACSGVATMIVPAIILPDVLKISVGLGGLGGAGGTSPVAGGNGTNSYIATGVGLAAGSAIPNILFQSGVNAPGGGNAGANSGAATGGTVPTIMTKATMGWMGAYGIVTFTVGLVGRAGGTPTAAGSNSTTPWQAIPLSEGAGGGGVTSAGTGFAGGNIAAAQIDLPDCIIGGTLSGGAAGGAGAAGNGNSGEQFYRPFLMRGGSGGGSADGSTGGNGGKGGIGCGGGGGGAGATAGKGGDGGNGIVIIVSW